MAVKNGRRIFCVELGFEDNEGTAGISEEKNWSPAMKQLLNVNAGTFNALTRRKRGKMLKTTDTTAPL